MSDVHANALGQLPGKAEGMTANPARPGRKIGVIGFAGSRTQAPYNDPSWELWGINDVYAHVPRVNVTFELHALTALQETGRRNPKYLEWLRSGASGTPVFMVDPQPDMPSAQRFPFEALRQQFPRDYWTNSVAWVIALAVLELTDAVKLEDGRTMRIARPGCELGLWGIHMAAGSEYQDQRRCCEYYIGIADGCQLPVHIPADSDLCKAGAVYGIDTTAPLRRNLEMKIAESGKASQQIDQQLANLQAQEKQLLYQKGVTQGQKEAYKYLRNNWTMPTDVVPTPEEREARHALPASAIIPASDNQMHSDVPVEVSVSPAGGP